VWKRLRNSLKRSRDEELFRYFQGELDLLKGEAKTGKIDLCYFDETGLNMNPNVPYAWQEKGSTALLPSERGKGVSILGILNPLKNTFVGNRYEGAANAECVIQTLDEFSKSISKKTILILDNASIHKSKEVKKQALTWKKRGLFLQFIPAYCPELNLIEILWKHLKHHWLKVSHYQSMDTLIEAADHILSQYGKDYSISFV
jgi:hypothetical protein